MPIQTIKRRIKSVSNTRQMTKAMQLVASSKLRHAEAALAAPTAYLDIAREIMTGLALAPEAAEHALFAPRPIHNSLIILIAGDRGLAGAYNSNLYRNLASQLHELSGSHQVITVGRRAAIHLARFANLKLIAAHDIDHAASVVDLTLPILGHVMDLYETNKIDRVRLIATNYESTIKQVVTCTQLLPQPLPPANNELLQPLLEASFEQTLAEAVIRVIEGELVHALTQARASEQAARMLAMMNATDNASDLIGDLTLELNTIRQARITQELAEITTGAAVAGV